MAKDSSTIGFGTSGLRGPAEGFTPGLVAAYVRAFLDTACAGAARRALVIGRDVRDSSPAIAALVADAAKRDGWQPVFAGTVPTPALASYAIERSLPAIMVTGSHIPPDYNGLKFYRPEGELLKAHEAPLQAAAEQTFGNVDAQDSPAVPPVDPEISAHYFDRFASVFAPDTLEGMRIGVFLHSAAGGDQTVEILEALGAHCIAFGRADRFVAVDTEAVAEAHLAAIRDRLKADRLDAVVSTDGDGDRPLLLDETGRQINGDVLGALAANALGARTVVTPLTSTSAIEMSRWFERVVRTRIGSPYVVAEMAAIASGDPVVGFEANGGFLVQTPITIGCGALAALPTRDALLPLIAVLGRARRDGGGVSRLASALPPRVMRAARLKNIAPLEGRALVGAMADDPGFRANFSQMLDTPRTIDTTDGTRLVLEEDIIVHFRQSGNAPELRCYVETASQADSETLLASMMALLANHFEQRDA